MSLDLLRQASWLDRPRARRFAAMFLVGALVVLALDFWAHTAAGVTDRAGEHLARDFANFWASGRAVLQGQVAVVYDTDGFLAFQRSLVGQAAEFKVFSYPPVALLMTPPLGLAPYGLALALWLGLGAVACAALLSRSLGWRTAALASVAAPAVLLNALSGQNGQLSAALFAGAILALEARPVLAGVLLGCLCYKPQIAILAPIALAAAGHWRAFLAAALTATALVAVSALAFGIEAWIGFLHHAPLHRSMLEIGEDFWRRMPTVFAAMRLIGVPPSGAYVAQALSAAMAAAAVAMIWRSAASIPLKGAALFLATFLATPYAWDYDLVLLTFAIAWIAVEAARTGFRPWERLTLALTWLLPLAMGPVSDLIHVQIAPALLWLLLGLVLARAKAGQPALQPVRAA